MEIQLTPKQKLELELEQIIKQRKQILSIVGAFGDIDNCEGHIRRTFQDKDGGLFVEFFGCTYYFKGWPETQIVEGIGLAKAMISVFPRIILGPSIILKIFLGLMFVFRRKKLIHWLNVYTAMIHGHVTRKVNFPPEKYNKAVKEMKRAFSEVVRKYDETILTRNREDMLYPSYNEKDLKGRIEPRAIVKILNHIAEFIWLFIEHDNAYRFPLQDIFPIINKEALKQNVRKELMRVYQQAKHRAQPSGILGKINQMEILFSLGLYFSIVRKFILEFIFELDMEKIKLDENDWYFCLKRKGWNFRGWTLEQRLRLKQKIDKEKHHFRLQLMDIQMPGEPSIKGFKIVKFDDWKDIEEKKDKVDPEADKMYLLHEG